MDGKAVPSEMFGHLQDEHFVDRNGQVYSAIIDYLRNGELPHLSTLDIQNVGNEAGRTNMVTLEGICTNKTAEGPFSAFCCIP